MPFTFSHPALVLPLKKRMPDHLSLTGLVVGSMIPDFEYFLRLKPLSVYSHTFWGLFYFDLPLALAVCFLFHFVVRSRLIDQLPNILYQRLYTLRSFRWGAYFKAHRLGVLLSILIGAITHLLWDAFTHTEGFFVQQIPFLSQTYILASWEVPGYKLAQHGSTVVGALVLCAVVLKLPRNRSVTNSFSWSYWMLLIATVGVVIGMRWLLGLPWHLVGSWVVTAISAGMLGVLVASLSGVGRRS